MRARYQPLERVSCRCGAAAILTTLYYHAHNLIYTDVCYLCAVFPLLSGVLCGWGERQHQTLVAFTTNDRIAAQQQD